MRQSQRNTKNRRKCKKQNLRRTPRLNKMLKRRQTTKRLRAPPKRLQQSQLQHLRPLLFPSPMRPPRPQRKLLKKPRKHWKRFKRKLKKRPRKPPTRRRLPQKRHRRTQPMQPRKPRKRVKLLLTMPRPRLMLQRPPPTSEDNT